MLRGAFNRRSGRVIALGRLALAAVFLFAIWLDPTQPSKQPMAAYSLLAGYVVVAAGLLLLTWRNWWLEYRLAVPAHILDLTMFGVLVFLTEGYTSPFYTFFVFLILSAAIRWSWRQTALTALAVLLLFLAAGTASLVLGIAEVEMQKLLIRCTYLVVLSLLLIWFGINQGGVGGSTPIRIGGAEALSGKPPIALALRHASVVSRARRLVLFWWLREEPWIHVAQLASGQVKEDRLPPQQFESLFATDAGLQPFLFNARKGQALARKPGRPHSLHTIRQYIDPGIARRFDLDEGLIVRIRSGDYEGELFALGIEGLCPDDLDLGQRLGREISSLFNRYATLAVSEDAAFARAKASLARDLHDSVVQALAGASFRLEALKAWIRAGKGPEPEIDAIKAELAAEQRNLRAFIGALRGGEGSGEGVLIESSIDALVDELERRWNLSCEFRCRSPRILAPGWMDHELRQIIREAAANAVRHGGATSISITLDKEESQLVLSVADNGTGFPFEGEFDSKALEERNLSPWSVYERVKRLGGTLSLRSGGDGSTLIIRVPLEEQI